MTTQLSKTGQLVLEVLVQEQTEMFTTQELQNLIKLEPLSAYRVINELREAGYIKVLAEDIYCLDSEKSLIQISSIFNR